MPRASLAPAGMDGMYPVLTTVDCQLQTKHMNSHEQWECAKLVIPFGFR